MPRILIVDDEPTILNLLNKILTGQGYDTVPASNGEKALVVEIDKQKPLLPKVKIIYEADGKACKTEKKIDLVDQQDAAALRIMKVIDPIDEQSDPFSLLRVAAV